MAELVSIFVEIAMGEVFGRVWKKLTTLPKPRTRAPIQGLVDARRAEIVRLANVARPTSVPGLSHLFNDERLILSMPVFLYESDSRRRVYPPANKPGRKLVWEHRASSGRRITISLVDHGTLRLTNRRFAFAGTRRKREFPIDELTHLSTSWSSIALAACGHHGVSYFTGLNASRLELPILREAEAPWAVITGLFGLKGEDLKDIVNILNNPSPPVLS